MLVLGIVIIAVAIVIVIIIITAINKKLGNVLVAPTRNMQVTSTRHCIFPSVMKFARLPGQGRLVEYNVIVKCHVGLCKKMLSYCE